MKKLRFGCMKRILLYRYSSMFRMAIINAIKDGKVKDMNLRSFPIGCCGIASNLLQRFLFEKNIYTLYMSGHCGYGENTESHAWLETVEETVIDITVDQFYGWDKWFNDSVYIGPRSNRFYSKYILDEPKEYEIVIDPFDCRNKNDETYQIVLKYFDNQC